MASCAFQRLVPAAYFSIAVYLFGFPILLASIMCKYRREIMANLVR